MSGDWYIKYRENMNLEYDLNGGTSGPNTTNFYAGFDCSLSLTKPYRPGYTFTGWKLGNNIYNPGDIIEWEKLSGDSNTITIEAQWTQNEYENIYHYRDSNGTIQSFSQKRYYGHSFDIPTETDLSIYNDHFWVFEGWTTSTNGTNVEMTWDDDGGYSLSTHQTLNFYAVSSRNIVARIQNSDSSNFYTAGTQFWNQISTDKPTISISAPISSYATTIDKYTFTGWSLSSGASIASYSPGITYEFSINYDNDPAIDFYPVYSIESYENIYIYKDYLGIWQEYTTSRSYGQPFYTPTRNQLNSIFLNYGWQDQILAWFLISPSQYGMYNIYGTTFQPGQQVTMFAGYPFSEYSSVIVFSAITLRQVSVTLYSNDDSMASNNYTATQSLLHAQDLASNVVIPTSLNPTREGYKFLGWSTSSNATSPDYIASGSSFNIPLAFNVMPTISLYAVWEKNIITVNLDHNNGIGTVDTLYLWHDIGWYLDYSLTTTISKIDIPSKTGYIFYGYYETSTGSGMVIDSSGNLVADLDYVNSNDTIYAVWKEIKYYVRFNINTSNVNSSGIMENQIFTYDQAQNLNVNKFINQGFEFKGWALGSNLSVTFKDQENVINLTEINNSYIDLFAVWEALNPAKYDYEKELWYVEMGKYPQTKIVDSNLIQEIKENSSQVFNRSIRIGNEELDIYMYNEEEYVLYNGNYYLMEPVRFYLADEFVEDFGTTKGEYIAVTDKVIFASVWSDEILGLNGGYYSENLTLRNNFENIFQFDLGAGWDGQTYTYATKSEMTWKVFSDASGKISAINQEELYSAPSSLMDIEKVFGQENYNAEFTDFISDILGNELMYWTRDVGSNLNTAECITRLGTVTQAKMQKLLGVRITLNISTLGCIL